MVTPKCPICRSSKLGTMTKEQEIVTRDGSKYLLYPYEYMVCATCGAEYVTHDQMAAHDILLKEAQDGAT